VNIPAGRTVSINGFELYYETAGDPDAPPLLLLHGGTGCCEDWVYAGREEFAKDYRLIAPDARGHGRSTNPSGILSHRQNSLDALALLDHLGIGKCKAIGLSFGGNTLLHVATRAQHRVEAMALVSATMHFPDQARQLMRQMHTAPKTEKDWADMRKRNKLGDAQILALWDWAGALAKDYGDVNFTPDQLASITADTLIIYGDRDPLYPVEMGVALYRAIPKAALWVVPKGGHGPVFAAAAPRFVETVQTFFKQAA
jgi:pimeloyl-ACP methyl ester carboxylesterase